MLLMEIHLIFMGNLLPIPLLLYTARCLRILSFKFGKAKLCVLLFKQAVFGADKYQTTPYPYVNTP